MFTGFKDISNESLTLFSMTTKAFFQYDLPSTSLVFDPNYCEPLVTFSSFLSQAPMQKNLCAPPLAIVLTRRINHTKHHLEHNRQRSSPSTRHAYHYFNSRSSVPTALYRSRTRDVDRYQSRPWMNPSYRSRNLVTLVAQRRCSVPHRTPIKRSSKSSVAEILMLKMSSR